MSAIASNPDRDGSRFLFDSRSAETEPEEPEVHTGDALVRHPKSVSRMFSWKRSVAPNTLKLAFPSGDDFLVSHEVAEQMRLLMQRAGIAKGVRTLGVTSTVSGEGATFIARSLAGVLAYDAALTVCLLEFNWESDEVSESVQEVPVQGVNEIGNGFNTGKELTVISTGRVAPLQRSMFATSKDLAESIESMRDFFDIIIMDLPAVSNHAGVLSLGEYADSYVLVAQQGVAPAAGIRRAIDDMGSARLAGVVLNKAELAAPKWLTRLAGN